MLRHGDLNLKNRIYNLDRENALGLVIDFQEKLFPAMRKKEELEENVVKLCRGLCTLDIPMIVTQQYTKGLGESIEAVREAIDDFSYYEKKSFTALTDEVLAELEKTGRKQIILFGIETHICVQQTAMDLLQRGYDVYLAADCCSSRKKIDKKLALANMRRAGCFVTTTEAILFDLLKTASAEGFKEISNIIK